MKKKVKQESENGEETKHLETLEDVSENSIREDGENESSAMQKDVAGDSGSGSSRPSSPSPPNRASMLLTPASADLFHRALIQGAETPDEFQRDISHIDLRQIKVVSDAEDGCFPSDGPAQPGSEGDVASDNASAYEPDDKENATLANGHEVEGHGVEVAKEDYVPMFASIAHTPQQVREIHQMRERVIKARESRSSSRSHESIET